MKTDQAEWLFEHLGLAVLCEDERSIVVSNAAWRNAGGRDQYPNFGIALRKVLGDAATKSDFEDAVARARAGATTELIGPNGEHVLLAQASPGRALAVIAPRAARAFQTDVAASVSHELANALGAITGWARLAKQGRRVHEALDLIEMSAESAWSAAQRVLSGMRERGTSSSIDLSAFVDEVSRLLVPKASAKGVQVRTAIEPGLRIRGDRGSAWSIVWNLAANAVEALSHGGTVELRLSRSDGAALLVIEDDGPGMNPEQQKRAFDPYYTTKPTGTGLGLSLVKQAVADVGGQIELVTETGRGTRFTLSLPLAPASSARQANLKRSSGVFYAEPIHQRILVVDDDLGLREMVSTALGMRGAEVVTVDSADAALAQTGPFAVAIVDLLLPAMRGDALLARLREAGLVEIGILMTGTELPSNLAPGGRPDLLLRKPFELEELFESLAASLVERGDRQGVGRAG